LQKHQPVHIWQEIIQQDTVGKRCAARRQCELPHVFLTDDVDRVKDLLKGVTKLDAVPGIVVNNEDCTLH
jgi:hypothetical protein